MVIQKITLHMMEELRKIITVDLVSFHISKFIHMYTVNH